MSKPSYELYATRGNFFVVRVVDEEETIIERFDDLEAAESFIDFLHYVATAPRRMASH